MNDRTILNTHFAEMYNLNPLVKKAYKWLINKSQLDMDQKEYVDLVESINPIIKNPISECFLNIKRDNSFENIYFISTILNKKADVPEILTIADLTIYGKYVNDISDNMVKLE